MPEEQVRNGQENRDKDDRQEEGGEEGCPEEGGKGLNG
jgi:hypothetical protein